MKKTLLIALFLIPFWGISQTTKPIDGFLGVKFGSSKADVIAALKAKGATLAEDNAEKQEIVFTHVKLGKREVNYLFVFFTDNRAFAASFSFKPEDQPKTLDYYNDLVGDINGVYGPGKGYMDFKSPYKYGDGYEITALQGGYATVFTNWKSDKNSIQANIAHNDDELTVILLYRDGVLGAENDAKEKAKEKGDF